MSSKDKSTAKSKVKAAAARSSMAADTSGERRDKLTREERSRLMSRVKAKDSDIELRLRKALWARGLRYRKHYRKMPGTPDLAFVGAKVAVFVDSEFWHGHDWERRKNDLHTNREFWIAKIEANIARDRRVDTELQHLGWIVVRLWGRQIKRDLTSCIAAIESVAT